MRAQPVNFERGQDPKDGLKIGVNSMIPSITSYDLEQLVMYYMEGEEEIRNLVGDDEEYEENYGPEWWNRMERINLALKGKIKMGHYYDWKEFDNLDELINRKRQQKSAYKYFYNASPGQDGIALVMSKIPLPGAEDVTE